MVGNRARASVKAQQAKNIMTTFLEACYDETDAGDLVNMGYHGRISGLNMPWSNRGRRDSGLTRLDGDILRKMVMQSNPCPLVLNPHDNQWYIDIDEYPTVAHGRQWLMSWEVTTETWLSWEKRLSAS